MTVSDGNRQTSSDDDAGNYLETVEGTVQTEMGTVKARSAGMAGKQDVVLGRPLHLGGDKILPETSNIQRNTDQTRPGQLFGLLFNSTCFEIEPNRRMPNGTSGGVRG